MVARLFPTSWFFLVAITSHFIGARADLYPIKLKEDQEPTKQQLDLKNPCFISLPSGAWQCGEIIEKPNRGLVVKRSGQLAVFTNRFTGWLKKIKAAYVIYPGEGVKMVEEGKRVVFKHVDSHKEAAVKLSNKAEGGKLSFSQREFQASETTQIAGRWYIASFSQTASWQLDSSKGQCQDGVALISNRKGKLEWKVFGFWSRGMKKKAVAGICPGMGVRVSKEGSAVVFTYQPQTSTRKMLLIPTQVDIGSYYVPYHIDLVDHVRPGIVKVPADQTCSLEYHNLAWECKTVEKRRGRPKGLMLNFESGNRQRGVFKYSRLSRFGTNRYAAFIVPGAGVTVGQSRSNYLIFHHGRHAAVFPLGDIFGLMAARDNDPVAIAFARGEIDDDSAVTLSIESTDAKAPAEKLTIGSPTGVISYDGGWQYTGGATPPSPSSTKPQGLAILKSIGSMLSANVYFDQGHPLPDAVAAVYAGPDVKMTREARGTHIVHQETGATGWIANDQARKPKGYMYAGAQVPYEIKYTSWKVNTMRGPQFNSVLQPSPVLGSLAVYALSFSDEAWHLEHSASDPVSPDDAPFLALEAFARPFEDRAFLELAAVSKDGSFSPDTIAIIKAGDNVKATIDAPWAGYVEFKATGKHKIPYTVQISMGYQLAVRLKVPAAA